jgi:hypothetical protein
VSNQAEEAMDLWSAIGVSPMTGLLAAGGALIVAAIIAVGIAVRRPKDGRGGSLRLD